jgi:glycosyltransferase involved in cell wall biosynthesis
LRILILSWRCPKNPQAGGAEFLTHEWARRLVMRGNQVEWFAATYPGGSAKENIDGITVIREGRQPTVQFRAFQRYRGHLRDNFDAVIDEVNTLPFFTPLWADVPTFLLMFQLARNVWWYEAKLPLSAIGYVAEPFYLKCYRNTPVFTISESTKSDLFDLGLRGRLELIPIGIEPVQPPAIDKEPQPTFIYVGRLAASKRVDDIVRALARFRQQTNVGQLWVVGAGSAQYRRRLERLALQLGVAAHIRFWGRLTSREKHQLMARAHMLLMASVREGWGLVIAEANACGTPAVAYDVPGLRDSVLHEHTGLLVRASPEHLATGMLRLWTDPALLENCSTEAKRQAAAFSLDIGADRLEKGIAASLASNTVRLATPA